MVYQFKVCVVGDRYTGKTCLLHRYFGRGFVSIYKVTMGADINRKSLELDSGEQVDLSFFDIMGQDTNYIHVTRVYLKNLNGLIVVFDVTDVKTLQNAVKWKERVDDIMSPLVVPSVLVANKSDLSKTIDEKHLADFSASNNFTNFFYTSAVTGSNVTEAFEYLIAPMIEDYKEDNQPMPTFPPERKKESSCCGSKKSK